MMRYSQTEKMEIIGLFEESELPVTQTLDELDVARSTFYRWYSRYKKEGYAGHPSSALGAEGIAVPLAEKQSGQGCSSPFMATER